MKTKRDETTELQRQNANENQVSVRWPLQPFAGARKVNKNGAAEDGLRLIS